MNPIGCIEIMNPIVKSLLEFNEAFEIPKLDAPDLGPDELIELRIKLLMEEVQEYAEAARAAAAAPARSAQNPPPQGNATQKKSEKGKLKQCPELQLLPLHSEE